MIGLIAGWLVSRSIAKGGALALPHARRLAKTGLIGVAVVLIGLALGAAWMWNDVREKADDTANQEIGATIQREGDLVRTIERTEQAHDAREEIEQSLRTGGNRAAYDQCVRTARTPANCVRYLPGDEED